MSDFEVADGDFEVARATGFGGVVGEGVLGFGHADGQVSQASLSELLEACLRLRGENDAARAVDAGGDGGELFHDGGGGVVKEGEWGGLAGELGQ